MSRVYVHPVDVFAERFDTRVISVGLSGLDDGIAREAARIYPEIGAAYEAHRKAGALRPGSVIAAVGVPGLVVAVAGGEPGEGARGSYALACCEALADLTYVDSSMCHVAVPAIGCGLGGLSWEAHARAFRAALLRGHKAVTFYLSPPQGPDLSVSP